MLAVQSAEDKQSGYEQLTMTTTEMTCFVTKAGSPTKEKDCDMYR